MVPSHLAGDSREEMRVAHIPTGRHPYASVFPFREVGKLRGDLKVHENKNQLLPVRFLAFHVAGKEAVLRKYE
jgi:hypothetical protein